MVILILLGVLLIIFVVFIVYTEKYRKTIDAQRMEIMRLKQDLSISKENVKHWESIYDNNKHNP